MTGPGRAGKQRTPIPPTPGREGFLGQHLCQVCVGLQHSPPGTGFPSQLELVGQMAILAQSRPDSWISKCLLFRGSHTTDWQDRGHGASNDHPPAPTAQMGAAFKKE